MDFTKPPYILPHSLPNAKKVNRVLKESFDLQRKVRLSNACGIVNIILQKGLGAVGIKSEVIHGSLKGPDIRIQHVWLKIHDHIINNTYVELPVGASAENLLSNHLSNYEEIVPSENSENIYLGDEITRQMGIDDRAMSPKVIKWQVENKDKSLLMSLNKHHIKRYLDEFAAFLNTEYSVTNFPAIDINDACWNCGNERVELELEKCSKCKCAKYCDRKCQRKDWKRIHKDVCIPPEIF